MKRVLTIAALTAAVSLLLVGGAFAGTQDGAVITLHAKAHTSKSLTLCTTWAPTVPCSEYVSTWPLGLSSDVYLVVAKAPDAALGIAGMSCGIDYNGMASKGVDVFGWNLCADLQFTNSGAEGEWPAAGGGNRITWVSTTNCQTEVLGTDGVHAIGGAFYLYAYSGDVFQVTGNMNLVIPELAVADCNASTTMLPMDGQASGSVGFGEPGCNPCVEYCGPVVPVESTTWGRVKTQY
jgi:hypothetical protein